MPLLWAAGDLYLWSHLVAAFAESCVPAIGCNNRGPVLPHLRETDSSAATADHYLRIYFGVGHMSEIGRITDRISTIKFTDDPRPWCSFASWEYGPDPSLVRPSDGVPEIVKNMGGIPGGKMPLHEDTWEIIGFAPQCDSGAYPDGKVTGFRVIEPTKAQLDYICVNEFYGPSKLDFPHDQFGMSVTYSLDGSGNVKVEVAVSCYDFEIAPSIQNLHLLTLGFDGRKMGDWNAHYQKGAGITDVPAAGLFGSLSGNNYFLLDENPKHQYPIGKAFTQGDANYYLWQTQGIPSVIGCSRVADGCGVLAVHGQLPTNSQPVVLFMDLDQADGKGIMPLLSQFAWCGFCKNTITRFVVWFLPLDGPANGDQKVRALQLANFVNPVSIESLF